MLDASVIILVGLVLFMVVSIATDLAPDRGRRERSARIAKHKSRLRKSQNVEFNPTDKLPKTREDADRI